MSESSPFLQYIYGNDGRVKMGELHAHIAHDGTVHYFYQCVGCEKLITIGDVFISKIVADLEEHWRAVGHEMIDNCAQYRSIHDASNHRCAYSYIMLTGKSLVCQNCYNWTITPTVIHLDDIIDEVQYHLASCLALQHPSVLNSSSSPYTYDLILTSYDGERWIDEVIGSDKDKSMVRLALQFLSRNSLSQEHYYWIDVSAGN